MQRVFKYQIGSLCTYLISWKPLFKLAGNITPKHVPIKFGNDLINTFGVIALHGQTQATTIPRPLALWAKG